MADIFDPTQEQRAGVRVAMLKNALSTVKNLCDPTDPEVQCILNWVAAYPQYQDMLNAVLAIRNIIAKPTTDTVSVNVKGLGR